MSIIIDSFYCEARRTWPHIEEEIIIAKLRIEPTGADNDATSTIILESFVLWVRASLLHVFPDIVIGVLGVLMVQE